MPKTGIDLVKCNFKGDTTNDAFTSGLLVIKADCSIK